jgi:hypothetical protein
LLKLFVLILFYAAKNTWMLYRHDRIDILCHYFLNLIIKHLFRFVMPHHLIEILQNVETKYCNNDIEDTRLSVFRINIMQCPANIYRCITNINLNYTRLENRLDYKRNITW